MACDSTATLHALARSGRNEKPLSSKTRYRRRNCMAILTAATATAVALDVAAASRPFHVETIAPDVCAIISDDPLGFANHSNTVFIVGPENAIVVDSQFTLQRTRDVLQSIRDTTSKPVRLVINTHWQDDHTFGNQIYRAAFQAVEFIAHAHTKADRETVGVQNRPGQAAGSPDAPVVFRDAITTRTSLDGTPMSDREAIAYETTIAIVERYLHDVSDFTLTLPTTTFDDQLTLTHGERTIEIRDFGAAVTRGDAIYYCHRTGFCSLAISSKIQCRSVMEQTSMGGCQRSGRSAISNLA